MTLEEKRAWIRLVVAVVAYGTYAIIVLNRVDGGALSEAPYAATLLWSIGGGMVATIVAEIVASAVNPKASRAIDVRDKEIGRLGDYIGQSFVIVGALAGMLMAIAEWDRFWIANAIYLCFMLSAILGNVAKIGLYRGTFPRW